MSDVEKFYYAVQKQFKDSVTPWSSLRPIQQDEFIRAVNVILNICTTGVCYKDEEVL